MRPGRRLVSHPEILASDKRSLEEYLFSRAPPEYFKVHRIGISSGELNATRSGSIKIYWADGFNDLDITINNDDRYLEYFLVSGSSKLGRAAPLHELRPGDTFTVSPYQSYRQFAELGSEYLAVSIDRLQVDRKLSLLLGAEVRFELPRQRSGYISPYKNILAQNVSLMADSLDIPGEPPEIFLKELEDFITVLFVLSSPHKHKDLLDRSPPAIAPWQVRLAAEHVEANWDRPVSMEKLSEATGADIRSLFRTFRHARGQSLMQFARNIRLGKARSMLLDNRYARSIINISQECGFPDIGRFAKFYRDTFGDPPSATRARGRQLLGESPDEDTRTEQTLPSCCGP